ncbi:AAA family ATPase [Corynebacterium sp. S7]
MTFPKKGKLTPREQARLEGIPESQLGIWPDTHDDEPTPWGEAEREERKSNFQIIDGDDEPLDVAGGPTAEQEQAAQESLIARFERLAIGADELDALDLPDPEWIVPGILTEGLGMIAAAPKIGKSWFVLEVGLAVAMGGRALGSIEVKQRPVLYFALEDNRRRLKKRIRALMPDGAPHPTNFHLITEARDLNDVILLGQVFQDLYEGEAPLIIVDTLGRVKQGKTSSQSQYDADYKDGAMLQERLANRVAGSAVLVVHHTNKGAHEDFLDGISGTQGVAGAYDTLLVLKRSRQSDEGILQLTGRDIENETEYALRTVGGKWSLIGGSLAQSEAAAEQVKANDKAVNFGDRKRKILEVVNRAMPGAPVSPHEVSIALDIDKQVASNNLAQLAKAGQIVKAGYGRYAPISDTSLTGSEPSEPSELPGQTP